MPKKPSPAKTGAVLYCRVSTKEQLSNFSLGTQEETCRKYCDRAGYEVLRVFSEAESAKSVDRPRFQEMLAYCSSRRAKIVAVVVHSVSRFARNSLDHLTVRQRLQSHGIRLESATEGIDGTPTGKFNERVIAAFAELDNDLRAKRTIEGMQAAVSKGHWVHKVPIGYSPPCQH